LPKTPFTQKAFDGDNGHLHRLFALKPGQRPAPTDLWEYTQDLRYTHIDARLLARLMPACLEAWRDDLRGTHRGRGVFGYGAFVEHFYPVLADRQVFDHHLNPTETAAASEFMRRAILEEIDDQRGLAYEGMNARPYRWMRALTTHGVLRPDMELLWTAWWSLETKGRAVSLFQYVSALMYGDDDNPVFTPWTCDRGGGPPSLWDFAGNLYSHRWLQPNVDFLRRTLTVSAVRDGLKRAAECLADEPERGVAGRVVGDLPSRVDALEKRCADLATILETTQKDTIMAWPV
jgi:hypothetical protein